MGIGERLAAVLKGLHFIKCPLLLVSVAAIENCSAGSKSNIINWKHPRLTGVSGFGMDSRFYYF